MIKRNNFTKSLIYKIFAITLISCLIPIAVFFYFVKNNFVNYVNLNNTKNMEFYKDSKIHEIKTFYSNLISYIDEFSNNNLEINMSKNILANRPYIENIYLIDEKFNVKNVLLPDNSFLDMLENLKKVKFSSEVYIGNFIVKNDKAYQYIYKKIIINGNDQGYFCFVINNSFLNTYVKQDSTKNFIDIYNGEYYIINSTDESKNYNLNIDSLSKKMLAGNIGTEVNNNIKYNYGFINLDDNSLYIMVYNYQSNIFSDIDDILTYMKFISILMLIMVFVIAWKFKKTIINYTIQLKCNPKEYENYNFNKTLKEQVEDSINLCNRLIEMEGEIIDIKSKLSSINEQIEKKRVDIFEGEEFKEENK